MNYKSLPFVLGVFGLLISGCESRVPAPGGLSPVPDATPAVSAPAVQPTVVADPAVVTPEALDAGPLGPPMLPSVGVSQPAAAQTTPPSAPASN